MKTHHPPTHPHTHTHDFFGVKNVPKFCHNVDFILEKEALVRLRVRLKCHCCVRVFSVSPSTYFCLLLWRSIMKIFCHGTFLSITRFRAKNTVHGTLRAEKNNLKPNVGVNLSHTGGTSVKAAGSAGSLWLSMGQRSGLQVQNLATCSMQHVENFIRKKQTKKLTDSCPYRTSKIFWQCFFKTVFLAETENLQLMQ